MTILGYFSQCVVCPDSVFRSQIEGIVLLSGGGQCLQLADFAVIISLRALFKVLLLSLLTEGAVLV